ncbi:MAG: uridine kinase [Bacteroidia bacterium]
MARYFVGITGASASGKTYFTEQLRLRLAPEKVTLISIDHYYKPKEEIPLDEAGRLNFDHPNAVNLTKLHHDLLCLKKGQSIQQLEYTFNNPLKTPRLLTFHATPVILVEGLFTFYTPQLRQVFDLKIFLDAQEPYRFLRRIERDERERGYTSQKVITQYLEQVLPMYRQFVEPQRDFCDLILPIRYETEPLALEILVAYLRKCL